MKEKLLNQQIVSKRFTSGVCGNLDNLTFRFHWNVACEMTHSLTVGITSHFGFAHISW